MIREKPQTEGSRMQDEEMETLGYEHVTVVSTQPPDVLLQEKQKQKRNSWV